MLSQLLSILSRKKLPDQSTTQSSAPSELSVSSPVPSQELSVSQKLMEQLKTDEGYRGYAYQDHLGYWTIGYGRLIDKRKGGGISKDEAEYLFRNDVAKVQDELSWRLPYFDHLTEPRQAVLVNMGYQLGVAGLLGFKRTLEMIRAGQYDQAADNMLKSKWAKQTPARAKRMAEQMRTNQWQSG